MRVVAKRLGTKGVKLGPDLPVEGAWLWGAFCALDKKRTRDMGLGAILYSEMLAFAQLWGFRWQPPEIAIIDALDIAYRTFAADTKPKGGVDVHS